MDHPTRIIQRAETIAERRMDRPRLDDGEDDDAWDEAFHDAIQDAYAEEADYQYERLKDRRMERKQTSPPSAGD